MTEATEKHQIALRIDPRLVEEIDARIALMKEKGVIVSRNQWFENMARWVVDTMPHNATSHHLIKAWPSLPPEALRIDK